jgi:mannose-6-phosphate isomerase-like protein (cupin superfamily)
MITKKPWGSEFLIEKNDNFTIKKIVVDAGKSSPLQYHEKNKKTILHMSGPGYLNCSDEKDEYLYKLELKGYASKTIWPYHHHRFAAESSGEAIFLEISSADLGEVKYVEKD